MSATEKDTFPFRIVTPEREVVAAEAASIAATTLTGVIEVFPGHEALLTPLAVGLLAVRDTAGTETLFAVHGGFLEAGPESATVLADTAERSDEVDLQRARQARERAESLLAARRDRKDEIDADRAEFALLRAINRIQAAEKNSLFQQG